VTLTRPYTETYTYDAVGNLVRLAHSSAAGYTRDFELVPGGNRLVGMVTGDTRYAYTFDANGNMRSEADTRHFDWGHGDRLRAFATQVPGAEPSVHAQYLYDANGQRVKKLVRRQGGAVEVTHYIGGSFEHHRWSDAPGGENNLLHVTDNGGRIAIVRAGPAHPDDRGPAVAFHLPDNLGSGVVVVDGTGAPVNREEYTPYGETSFGSFARKRYRFTGKERDEESGLNYHGARYLNLVLARWLSTDPAGPVRSTNLYGYGEGAPTRLIDPDGRDPKPPPVSVRDVDQNMDGRIDAHEVASYIECSKAGVDNLIQLPGSAFTSDGMRLMAILTGVSAPLPEVHEVDDHNTLSMGYGTFGELTAMTRKDREKLSDELLHPSRQAKKNLITTVKVGVALGAPEVAALYRLATADTPEERALAVVDLVTAGVGRGLASSMAAEAEAAATAERGVAKGAMTGGRKATPTGSKRPSTRQMIKDAEGRMKALGLEKKDIGIIGRDGKKTRGYDPHETTIGGSNSGGLNIDAGIHGSFPEPWPAWEAADLPTRMEAVIAHEWIEVQLMRDGVGGAEAHAIAVEIGPLTDLPISEKARRLLADFPGRRPKPQP
jgi:RHS repeat-associated protein